MYVDIEIGRTFFLFLKDVVTVFEIAGAYMELEYCFGGTWKAEPVQLILDNISEHILNPQDLTADELEDLPELVYQLRVMAHVVEVVQGTLLPSPVKLLQRIQEVMKDVCRASDRCEELFMKMYSDVLK